MEGNTFQTLVATTIPAILIYFLFLGWSAGNLIQYDTTQFLNINERTYIYVYVVPGGIWFAITVISIGAIWVSWFITDCQSMIVAGIVARWYFAR